MAFNHVNHFILQWTETTAHRMGGLYKTLLDIECDEQIYKVSDTVFCYSRLDLNELYIQNICSILDKGSKFVPSFIDNIYDYFTDIYTNVDNALVQFNKSVMINKLKNFSSGLNLINEPTTELAVMDNANDNDSNSSTGCDYNFSQLRNYNIKSYSNIPVQIETTKLRIEIFKAINFSYNNALKCNLSSSEIETLKDFCLKKPFKILKCDKNVGTMLISTDNEALLAEKVLSDHQTYKKLDSDETNNIINKINQELVTLHERNHITKSLLNKLYLSSDCGIKCGKLKLMPKIHKKVFGIRQIISCINHPTTKLCKAIDIMLNPYVKSIKHILKDSQQLLQETEKLVIKNEMYLYSCDFESLYTNIKPSHAIDAISNFLQTETNLLILHKIDIVAVKVFLNLIFTCNIFSYKNSFYLQLIGVPMGCIAGPVIANMYIYILERKWLSMNPDIIYYRFIDDIFIAALIAINLDVFKSNFLYLKLNIECSKNVVFLDLDIKVNKITGRFGFSLFTKPTNTFGYLLPSSNHPKHIFRHGYTFF